jgi:Co/Zn/Cd efflux system component
MGSCCEEKKCEIEALKDKHASVLKVVLLINLLMFFVEFISGWISGSVALSGDSLDMFGDATVYALSLYTLARVHLRSNVTILKGLIMILMASAVLFSAFHRTTTGGLPAADVMGLIGLMALIANSICFALLMQFRSDDINMRSVWLCSRNDLIANVAVLCSAAFAWKLKTAVPDIVVGAGIAAIFLHSSWEVLKNGFAERRTLLAKNKLASNN